MQETLELAVTIKGENIEIWRYGVNDYSVNFIDRDFSVRGSLAGVILELVETLGLEALEELDGVETP